MLKRNSYFFKKEANKSEWKGLYHGDVFGDPHCSWGDGGRDCRAVLEAPSGLMTAQGLVPVLELVSPFPAAAGFGASFVPALSTDQL